MLDSKNELVLVDFGIANHCEADLFGTCGTPGFNAPEQFADGVQRYPLDIFSLGKNLILILFEWKIGWNLLLSSEKWLHSQKLEHKLTPLSNLFGFIRLMMQVLLLISLR